MMTNKALLLVDLQNDFCPDGSLAVNEGEQTVIVANQVINLFQAQHHKIIATQDWHPENHKSFASQSNQPVGSVGELAGLPQVFWPDHCIQNSVGAELHPNLMQNKIDKIIYKGTNPDIDSYSAFFDNGRRQQTALNNWLKSQHITHLTIMGLATDYCVKFTVLDALSLGYQVDLLADGCRGVNISSNDSKKAIDEMVKQGAKLVTLNQLASS